MGYHSFLQQLLSSPNHKLLIYGPPYWVCIRSFTPPNRMLIEVSSNKHLPVEHQISKEQELQLTELNFKSRRQGYSLGKLMSAVQVTDVPKLSAEIQQIFSDIFQVQQPTDIGIEHSPSSQIYNHSLLGKMKESARRKDHQLRLELYTIMIDATFLALVDDNGVLIQCDTITGLPCFGVFTDEKHAFQFDPRGLNLQVLSAIEVIHRCIAQGAGSLWINPKGETRGELYKNEIEELWRRTRRLRT